MEIIDIILNCNAMLRNGKEILETQQADLSMTFKNFIKLYNEDMRHRLREHTFIQKQFIINKKLLPFLGKMPVNQITPASIRKWQNKMISYKPKDGSGYSETYLKTINNQITAMSVSYTHLDVYKRQAHTCP